MRLCHLSLVQQLIKFKARCKHRCILALGLSLILILCVNLRVPWGLSGKESVCNEGDPGSTSGSGRSPGEGNGHPLQYSRASLGAQTVKNPPAVWETRIRSLGGEDPLEKGMATHSSILAWRIPWTEDPGGLQFMGSRRVRHD